MSPRNNTAQLASSQEDERAPGRRPAEPAIIVENLSKRYRLSPLQVSVAPIPSLVPARLRRHRQDSGGNDRPRHLWALREVSFGVAAGSAVGIVGPNGSGKSTLLRILARMTPPTGGSVHVRGRIMPMAGVALSFLDQGQSVPKNIFELSHSLCRTSRTAGRTSSRAIKIPPSLEETFCSS